MPRASRSSLRWLALLPLVFLAVCLAQRPAPVLAQGPGLAIDQASLRLWPEYDDPGLLVILSGAFTGTAKFPQQVAFPIPPNARGIQATMVESTGNLLSQPWQIVDGKLTYLLPGPDFQIEYYVDRPPSGNQRDLSYTFESSYPIRYLEATLQQPARADAFAATPEPERSTQGSDGFTYYLISRNDMPAGDKLPFGIRYTKNDQGLSVAQAKIDTGAPASSPGSAAGATTATGIPSWLPFFLIGLGLAALAGAGAYWYLRMRPARTVAPARSGDAKQGRPNATPAVAATGKTLFCTRCGHQLAPDDRFCAQCGAPRKN